MKLPWILNPLAVLLLLAGAGVAKDWESAELKCALTLPENPEWTVIAPPGPTVHFAIKDPSRTASFAVIVTPLAAPGLKMDQSFTDGFDRGYFPAGKSKKTSGEILMIKGDAAYKATGEMTVNGATLHRAVYVWIRDQKVYQLSALKFSGLPLEDADIKSMIASFHFVN